MPKKKVSSALTGAKKADSTDQKAGTSGKMPRGEFQAGDMGVNLPTLSLYAASVEVPSMHIPELMTRIGVILPDQMNVVRQLPAWMTSFQAQVKSSTGVAFAVKGSVAGGSDSCKVFVAWPIDTRCKETALLRDSATKFLVEQCRKFPNVVVWGKPSGTTSSTPKGYVLSPNVVINNVGTSSFYMDKLRRSAAKLNGVTAVNRRQRVEMFGQSGTGRQPETFSMTTTSSAYVEDDSDTDEEAQPSGQRGYTFVDGF